MRSLTRGQSRGERDLGSAQYLGGRIQCDLMV